MALSLTARQAIWYQNGFIEFKLDISIALKSDSTSAINITFNPILHQRAKHIDTHYHYTRHELFRNHFTLEYIATDQNLADIFTEALENSKHLRHLAQLGCTV